MDWEDIRHLPGRLTVSGGSLACRDEGQASVITAEGQASAEPPLVAKQIRDARDAPAGAPSAPPPPPAVTSRVVEGQAREADAGAPAGQQGLQGLLNAGPGAGGLGRPPSGRARAGRVRRSSANHCCIEPTRFSARARVRLRVRFATILQKK